MIKNLIKKNKFLFNFLKKLKIKIDILLRLKDVTLMMMLFHLCPSYIYKFSTRKLLPSKKNRFCRPKKIEPYKIINNKSKMEKLGEINLVTLGPSFNINNLKKLKGKIFFSPGWEPLKTDQKGNIYSFRPGWNYNKPNSSPEFRADWHNWKGKHYKGSINRDIKIGPKNQLKDYTKKNIVYCIGRKEVLDEYLKKGYNFLSISTYYKNGKFAKSHRKYWESKSFKNLFKYKNFNKIALLENFSNPPAEYTLPKWAPTGSIIPVLFALSKYAKKINVYGWDFYLDKSPEKMSYWEFFFNLYKYKLDVLRSKNHFESALFNFYYGYKLSKMSNIKIYSNMGKLEKHKNLINKIERVLYQS